LYIGNIELTYIAETLDLKTKKAVKNNINLLLERNWIDFDKSTGYYYIRGFDKIRKLLGLKKRTGAEFNSKDIKKFKGFITGAVIGYLAISQRRKRRAGDLNSGRSNAPARHNLQYYEVANTGIAKILKVSVSTAFEYKQLAKKEGYILVKKRLLSIGVPAKYIELYKNVNPDEANKIRTSNGDLLIQQIDLITPCISFRRRKKIET
jgi:hypothetical protein